MLNPVSMLLAAAASLCFLLALACQPVNAYAAYHSNV